MAHRTILKAIFAPIVVVVAAVYFAIDALVLSIIKPLARKISNLEIFRFIPPWIASLGPYSTLALFVIPLAILEPIKPFGAYLMASGHFIEGVTLLVFGEVLKIIVVEHIFYIGRDKLMTIKAFAWIYNYVTGWLTWLRALPPWQNVKRRVRNFTQWARAMKRGAKYRGFT
jgi:hypothetical protein